MVLKIYICRGTCVVFCLICHHVFNSIFITAESARGRVDHQNELKHQGMAEQQQLLYPATTSNPNVDLPEKLMMNTGQPQRFRFEHTLIITAAKVGTTSLYHTLKTNQESKEGDSGGSKYTILRSHSIPVFERFLMNNLGILFIVGVRDPIARGLSYFFQTFNDDYNNHVITRKNSFGEYCYVSSLGGEDIVNKPVNLTIAAYFRYGHHLSFNDWFDDLFDLTKINETSFNKEKGLDFYKLSKNKVMIVFTLEKLQNNIEEICYALSAPQVAHHDNDGNEKFYGEYYKKVKKAIRYEQSFLDSLLDTHIMHFFYTQTQIEDFYGMYKLLKSEEEVNDNELREVKTVKTLDIQHNPDPAISVDIDSKLHDASSETEFLYKYHLLHQNYHLSSHKIKMKLVY